MLRRKPLLAFSFVVLAVAGTLAIAGCPGTATTTTYTPITGVVVKAADLIAGHGCGTGQGQVYRYAAILSYDDDGSVRDSALTSGVFDCYTDGIFSNLPADDAGSTSFSISIVAFNRAAFPAALDCTAGTDEAGTPVPCPGDDPDTVFSNESTATWRTTCTATQQSGVPVLAACAPLQATGSAEHDAGTGEASAVAGLPITIATSGFVLADGGTLTCADQYTGAAATYTGGTQSGKTPLTACPSTLSISPTVAGETYSIEVTLFQGVQPYATTSCVAEASSTTPVLASCAPIGAGVVDAGLPLGDP